MSKMITFQMAFRVMKKIKLGGGIYRENGWSIRYFKYSDRKAVFEEVYLLPNLKYAEESGVGNRRECALSRVETPSGNS